MSDKRTLPDMEKEASQFAFCLLMPEIMIENEMKRINTEDLVDCDVDIVEVLAEVFQVTKTIMAIRLTQLGYFP